VSDVVNLNKFRKRKKTAEKQAQAETNRTKFGRTKAEKTRDARARDELTKHVDGHRRESED